MTKPVLLITGAHGSIGTSLVARISNDNYFKMVTLGKNSNISDFRIDLTAPEAQDVVREINPDFVIHLAGNPQIVHSINYPVEDLKLNVLGTLNLIQGLSRKKRVTLSFANSGAIYDPSAYLPFTEESPVSPSSPYSISKLCAENYIVQQSREFGYRWTSLTISNSFGPYSTHKTGVISRIISAIKHEESLTLFGRETTRDFVHVEDVCNAFILSLKKPTNTRLNVSSMKEHSLLEVVTYINQISGKDFRPIWSNPSATSRNCLDNSKARELIGWLPTQEFFPALEKIVVESFR